MATQNEKHKIIRFIENSTDEENIKIAVFIAGMQAQKSIGMQHSNSSLRQRQEVPHKNRITLAEHDVNGEIL